MVANVSFAGYDIVDTVEETKGYVLYRGIKRETKETVLIQSLKTVTPSPVELALFSNEFKAVCGQSEEGMVRYMDRIDIRGSAAIILEDFKGIPLRQLPHTQPQEFIGFLDMAITILDTLAALHRKSIIHKNITPQSVLVQRDSGQVKLTHFGFINDLTHEYDAIYDPHVIRSYLAYISPEQTGHMNRPVDYRTDFYSLGCVLYERLTGVPPFVSENPTDMIHAHIARLPSPPHEVRPGIFTMISDIIIKLLAKNPEDRYQSGHGASADLAECRRQFKETRTIEPFLLGVHDIPLQFNIPHVLVGRENDTDVLMAAFNRISSGQREMVMVGGLPGIGKSTLINEIRKPVVANAGNFCSGKFDQFNRDVPYSAIIQALSSMIHQLLSQGDKYIDQWRKRIKAALGTNGKVLTDVIPALEIIIGPQPEVPHLEPEESKNRFNYLFLKFINAFAKREHALVLFLDDMQWSDVGSMELIKSVITHHSTRYFLLICAYRDNETGSTHPFRLMAEETKKAGIPIHSLKLGPMTHSQANRLVAIALRCHPEQAAALSEVIHQKTAGNPFFIIQFCKSLFDQGYLETDPEKGLTWDLNRISHMQVTDNVLDLMAERIRSINEKTRDTLMLSAAIGNEFNPEILAMVSGKPLEELIEDLSEAIRMNLITLNKETYLFLHDRIQEAAYSLIPENTRADIHLSIGRNMLEKIGIGDLADALFCITDHLNQGKALIHDSGERIELAELNLSAGEKARQSAAYRSAIAYLDQTLWLLGDNPWGHHYAMCLSVHMKKLECQSLSLDFSASIETLNSIEQNVRGDLDIAKAYNLITYLYTIHVDFEKALDYGLKGMALLGVKPPKRPSNLRILMQLITLRILFGRLSIEDVKDLPYCDTPERVAYAHLSVSTATVAFYVDTNLFTSIALTGGEFIIKEGLFEITPLALNAIGCILGSLGLFKHGFRFGETSLSMLDRPIYAQQRGRVLFLFTYVILHSLKHAKECIENFGKSFSLSLECGDLIYSLHSINTRAAYRIILGDNLDEVLAENSDYEMFVKESKDSFSWHFFRDNVQFAQCLKGESQTIGRIGDGDYSEEKALFYYRSKNNLLGVFYVRLLQLKIRYMFGQFHDCMEYFKELKLLLKSKIAIGTMFIPEFVLYQSLVMVALYPGLLRSQKASFRFMLYANQLKMKRWAKYCPDNYEHKYLLMRAERYRLKHKKFRAIKHYGLAISSATKYGYTQNRALSNERLGTYYLELGETAMASFFLTEAFACYHKAGYTAKMDLLLSSYPDLVKGSPSPDGKNVNRPVERLDLDTLMQISRAISGEVVLDKLLTVIVDMTMKRAGADRGFLFLKNDGKLFVEAQSDISQKEARGLESIPMENHGGFAQSVVHYVAHTRELLLLNHVSTQGEFTLDSYILDHQPGSVLCLPLLNQGRLSAIIYFENTLTANAFKPEHVDFLGLLSAQAAVAIDNARLYENLEEKVRLRTEELNRSLQTVEHINQKIMGSLKYAAMIQKSLLPSTDVIQNHLSESLVIWMPRDIVGGDIYHAEFVDGCLILAVIDCTGHGVPGAFMTMIASSGLRRIINEEKEYDPVNILKKLNVFVKTTLQQDKDNAHSDDGLDAMVCCYTPDSDTITFAGARQSLYMVKEGDVQVIKGDRKSLGYISSPLTQDFTSHTLTKVKGMCFYMPTDGYMDQLGECVRRRLGSEQFKTQLIEHHALPFEDQKNSLLNTMHIHKGSEDQTDDITILGFRL